MKDLNKTLSERATRFLPVDMKDRLKSAFNRNAPNAAPDAPHEEEGSEFNAIFNANRPTAAPKNVALNVPLVSGPAGSVEGDASSGAMKNNSRQVVTDIEDAEIVEPIEDSSNASWEAVSLTPHKVDDAGQVTESADSTPPMESLSSRSRPSGQTFYNRSPQASGEATLQNSKHEDAVSQKSKSRFFGDFSSTESVRLKVEKRNEKRSIEPMPPNGNSQARPEPRPIDGEARPVEQHAAPNSVFEAAPAEPQSDALQDSTEAVALGAAFPEQANVILQEEYESMDAKAHESENGATADANSGAAFAAIVIERNSKFSGQLKFAGAITIDGQVEGELIADRIVINEGGVANATVDAGIVMIAGTVRGDIRAHHELEILPSGVVDGSVTAPAITVRRGGRVEGRCTIGVPRQ